MTYDFPAKLRTLCGCERDIRINADRPPSVIYVPILEKTEPIWSPKKKEVPGVYVVGENRRIEPEWAKKEIVEEGIEPSDMRKRTFSFTDRSFDGAFVYQEDWEGKSSWDYELPRSVLTRETLVTAISPDSGGYGAVIQWDTLSRPVYRFSVRLDGLSFYYLAEEFEKMGIKLDDLGRLRFRGI